MADLLRPDNFFTVVVVGAMNPAIRHHAWYLHQDVLSKEEAEAALAQSGALVCTAQFSQFQFGSSTVTCDPIRWQISTADIDSILRIVRIADDTFSVLTHTPVSAFGFNFNYHRPTRLPKVKNTLARMVRGLPLGLLSEQDEDSAAKLNYQHSGTAGRIVTVQIEPSARADNQVYVAVNLEYQMKAPPGEFKSFDLKLQDRFPGDQRHAERQLESLLNKLNELEAN